MANPLSDKGWSDRDFAAAVGVAMGETGGRINRDEMAGVIDVLMNRQENWSKDNSYRSKKSNTIEALAFAPGQFDATNRRGSKDGRKNFNAGWNAVLSGKAPAANQRARYAAAIEEVINVATGAKRGLTRNADYFSATGYKMSQKNARIHDKLGRQSATKIGPTSFYGDKHKATPGYYAGKEQYGPAATTKTAQAAEEAVRARTVEEARAAPVAAPDVSMGRFYDAPAPPAWGLGDEGFGAKTYPELSAGLYPDIAPPDVPPVPDIMGQFDPTNMMTEQQAIENANLEGQRLSENVERREAPYGETIDQQIARNAAAAEQNDFLAASYGEIMGPLGTVRDNPAAYTTNPYEIPGGPMPERVDKGVWGGTTPFNDTFTGASRATPTFVDYENRSTAGASPLAALGIGGITSPGPVGMGRAGGVELQRDISGISAGMYPYEAVFEAVRNAPTTPQMSAGAPPASPGYVGGTTAQLGTPDFAALSALDRDRAYQAEVAAMRDPAAAAARGAWADQAEVGPRPAGPDPTPFQGGLYGDPATPAGGFTPGLDYSQPVGPSPDRFSGGPAEVAFNERISDSLRPGPAAPAELSPFQNTPLGLGQGIIDQGPYSSPIGYSPDRFSPANLGNPMPNSTAVATQSPQIVGYENKTITRDVPNPAWSEWSKDYATANASQNAWAAADEDKRAWDRAPPNPSVLADTQWAGLGKEPSKTKQETTVVQDLNKPIYSKPEVAAAVRAAPTVSVPAIQAQPVAAQPVAAQPLARTVSAPAAAPVGVGGWWDSITSGLGNVLSGMSLADMGAGYGAFGGAYDPGGYGGGGYGGTAPGDAGYGSDARSGAGNMGAGNLYQ